MTSPAAKKKTKATQRDEFPSGDRILIRHAYNELITFSARLASFAASAPLPDNWSVIEDRQEELAMGDLISFSLYLRRLIEIVGIDKELRAMEMPVIIGGISKGIEIVRVINTVIHHRRIHILRRKSDFITDILRDDKSYAEWLEARKHGFYPVIGVKSDRGAMIGFRIDLLIGAVNDQIIKKIVDYCDDKQLFLEDPFKD